MRRLSAAEFERALADYPLTFPGRRHPQVERSNLRGVRPMVRWYWDLTGSVDALPPPQMVWVEAIWQDLLAHQHPLCAYRSAVVRRLCVAYPSYVRQHHMELLLRERLPYVMHCVESDLRGYDLWVVSDQGRLYGVEMSLDSARARYYQVQKRRYRNPQRPVPRVVVWLRQAKRCGQFLLHPEADADLVVEQVRRWDQVPASRWWAQLTTACGYAEDGLTGVVGMGYSEATDWWRGGGGLHPTEWSDEG